MEIIILNIMFVRMPSSITINKWTELIIISSSSVGSTGSSKKSVDSEDVPKAISSTEPTKELFDQEKEVSHQLWYLYI